MIKRVLIKEQRSDTWLNFTDLLDTLCVDDISDISATMMLLEEKIEQQQCYAAGFLSYEAAAGFDENLLTHEASANLPLLCFGLFGSVERHENLSNFLEANDSIGTGRSSVVPDSLEWEMDTGEEHYFNVIDCLKQHIAAGDSYQINYTMRQSAEQSSDFPDPLSFFRTFAENSPYAAFVELEDIVICCASPELFFSKQGEVVSCRPMKGTAPRGLSYSDDIRRRDELAISTKNRAENLMILDMIRNDLGKISVPGSVEVSDKFKLEQYPSVWQMTSSVKAKTTASIHGVFSALFPCASITGAPKVETMRLIKKYETSPRGVYTGTIGFIYPNKDAQFNVAIRTAMIDRKKQRLSYGMGGGIVWDSNSQEEYQECLLKSLAIRKPEPNFSILESILCNSDRQLVLLEYHLARMEKSAAYFGFLFNGRRIRKNLEQLRLSLPAIDHKVRFLLHADGRLETEAAVKKLEAPGAKVLQVKFARQAIDQNNKFLYHKTTQRQVYEDARQGLGQFDDVILWNQKNEVTESTISNIVVLLNGEKITPSIDSGLLGGTMRQSLLDDGVISEAVITKSDLENADSLWLINSVRGWQAAELVL